MSTPPPTHPKNFCLPLLIGQVASSESDGEIINPWGPTPKGKRRAYPERMKRKLPLLIGQINSSDSSGEVSYRRGLAAKGKGREVDDGRRGQNVSVVSEEARVGAKEASPEEVLSFYYEGAPGSGSKGVDRNRTSSESGDGRNPIAPAAAQYDGRAELEEIEARQGLILYTVLLHRQLQDLADQIALYRAMDSLFDGTQMSKGLYAWEFLCTLHLQRVRNAIHNVEQNPAGPVVLAKNKFLAGSLYRIWKSDRVGDGVDLAQFLEPPKFTSLTTRRKKLNAFLQVLGETLSGVIAAAEKGAQSAAQHMMAVVADAIEILGKRRLGP
ncbi:MAG: hypothetical protein Q9187_003697 [Circinaria calcarea]